MILFKEGNSLRKYLDQQQDSNSKIGFVPTMGALHEGHISLIRMSKEQSNKTVCSIFINPTQFNDKKDFEKYPVTIAEDILKLEKAGCDILFLPSVKEIYPKGTNDLKQYNLGPIEFLLEGKYRPGHFQGVCQVVHKLLEVVQPTLLFIGQKDYQQCMVIKRLVSITKTPVEVIIGNTLREESGLAMSSRNQRLSSAQLEKATAIFKMLHYIKSNYGEISSMELISYATGELLNHGFNKVDYVSIADANTLEPFDEQQSNQQAVALVAAFIGDVRLIDNMILTT